MVIANVKEYDRSWISKLLYLSNQLHSKLFRPFACDVVVHACDFLMPYLIIMFFM